MSPIVKAVTAFLLGLVIVVSIPASLPGQQEGERRDRGGDRGGDRGSMRGGPGGRPGGPGGRGGFSGRRGGGLLGELGNESTRSEVNITDEQMKKLEEIGESMGNSREQFGDIFGRMQSASSNEEREKVRNELRAKMEEARKQSETQMKSVLSEEQFKRLDQIRLHREGLRAFGREEVQTELGLSDDQKKKLEELQESRSEKFRALGFGSSEEDRNKLNEEFEQATMAVLTDEQKQKWQQRIGPPPADAGQSRGQGSGGQPPPRRERPVMVEQVPEGAEAVLSFGEKRDEDDNTTKADRENVQLSFNFRYAPWTEVLRLFARESGLSLDLLDVPPGTFSYYDQKMYSPKDALDVINGYLLPKGFVLVHRDDFLVCLNIDDPIPPNLIPNVAPDELASRGKNELLTVVFPLEGVDAGQIAAEVNEVKGPQGKVVALGSSNSVLVTDIGSNLRRIDLMLKDITNRPGPDDLSFKPYIIKNIPAADAETLLRSVLGLSSGVTNVSAASSRRSSSSSTSGTGITIAADERTNKLLISATVKMHQLVEQALETIDVEGEPSTFSSEGNKPFLRVYTVTSANSMEVTKTITALMPGVVINEDARNGKIHILATNDKHVQVASLISEMDGAGSSSQQMTVIPLSKMDPIMASTTVRAMFMKDGDLAPTIEPDVYGRQLMVRGDTAQVLQVKELLAQLGEDGTGQRDRSSESRMRTFPLSGRDPEEILPLIQRMWNQRSSSPIRVVNPGERGPVRDIKSPAEGQSVRQPEPAAPPASTQQIRLDKNSPNSVQSNDSSTKETSKHRSLPVLAASQTTVLAQATGDDSQAAESEDSAGEPAEQTESANPVQYTDKELLDLLRTYINQSAPPKASESETAPETEPASPEPATRNQEKPRTPTDSAKTPSSDINVTVLGDELMLYSSDPEALNELEELLESTLQVIPPRTSWTVFTLQTADATEASLMLEQLLPYSNVSSSTSAGGMLGSFSGAASSLGSGLAEMTGLSSIAAAGQSLRIIPDTRLNALFVSGPAGQVKEVEEMLRVLDANEWPDSMRDKVTRLIPVEHADAKEVLQIVKETYKVYIDPPQQQQGRGNPLAAMMGGGRGGKDGDSPASLIKMAVSVDSNTNQLAVWADEALFREVETLVQTIDNSAKEARRTVVVVPLNNTNSSMIQNALGTLMPRVNVSSTGSRNSSNNSSNQSRSSSTSENNSDQDRIRQFMEQRMRERMQGGGGGNRPSTGGPGATGRTRGGGTSPFGGGGRQGGGGRTGGGRTGGR
ncbi:secretin N-terminal domain-containing protein [Thalassoglobus polymorphus]|uniref:Bacterial type II/III secretion system short domain protein n=1 Tax=Thalassoglobus polymorphus TaxID=2527994 RepID=A0A517QMH6_9PLAN|nr:secretin N-terminal domain-containing protein [Thalassoglobus polymorphus]QDT32844.1 Bacterial type II/III secretion system short domain protein [Thalassoglobus polymorphus]